MICNTLCMKFLHRPKIHHGQLLERTFDSSSNLLLLEVVAVFDADMVAQPNFFTRTLPWLQDGRQSIVLTPQFFHNFDPDADIFNHRSAVFWSVILSGWVSLSRCICVNLHVYLSVLSVDGFLHLI